MKYTVSQAEINLSPLLEEARAGKEVIIVRGRRPVDKLVAIWAREPKDRIPGTLKGKIICGPGAFDPPD
jgi:antitoxin (DNA-binding transcriptional repressor) of toxin-antitoxin stability system